MEKDGGSNITITAGVSYGGAKVGLSWTIEDNDDFLGNRYIYKSQLPFSGYSSFSTGDVQFYADKD